MRPIEFWNSKHLKYAGEDFVSRPNFLASEVVGFFAPDRRILDLGCGQGQDSLLFASEGHQVVATDFSPIALSQFVDKARSSRITQLVMDSADCPYPFLDSYFDVVYSHLSLHYFSSDQMAKIVSELSRILTTGGELHALFNSIHDSEYLNRGEERPGLQEVSPGDFKMFFSPEILEEMFGDAFEIRACEYGRGTQKKSEDEFVRLSAGRR